VDGGLVEHVGDVDVAGGRDDEVVEEVSAAPLVERPAAEQRTVIQVELEESGGVAAAVLVALQVGALRAGYPEMAPRRVHLHPEDHPQPVAARGDEVLDRAVGGHADDLALAGAADVEGAGERVVSDALGEQVAFREGEGDARGRAG
jgi:hypothetical protein